jgi:hypothetical protein
MTKRVAMTSCVSALFILSLALPRLAGSTSPFDASQPELVTTCKAIKDVAAASNPATQQPRIIVYRNAYWLLREKVSDGGQLTAEDAFFNQLDQNNRNSDLSVVISLGASPTPVKGWRHREIDTFFKEVGEKDLKPEDIKTVIQLKQILDSKQFTIRTEKTGRP